jgi:hypothetical protein
MIDLRPYKTRKIEFMETVQVKDWSIKIYSIVESGDFDHPKFYDNVKARLSSWVLMQNSFDSTNHKLGFLILHLGKEGIFSLINWWVDENMLNTHIFLTDPEKPDVFTKVSGDGLAPCVWELEVLYHEKNAWVSNVLRTASGPDFQGYLNDVYNDIV